MWYLSLLLLLQPAVAQPTSAPAAATEPPAPTTAPTYDKGPLRAEIVAMFDARYWYLDPTGTRPGDMQMRWRIEGDRLGEIARFGNIIFTQAEDDTGKALINESTYTAEEKTLMRPLSIPAERLVTTGLVLACRVDEPTRAAKTLKLRGSVHLVLAKGRQEITIDNPLQYVGKPLADDRLQKLGISITLVPPDQVQTGEQPPLSADRAIVVKYAQGQDRVQTVALYDAWMKKMALNERSMKTKDNETVAAFVLGTGEITDDCQLVLEVFNEVTDVQLPLDVDQQPLP